MNNNYSFPRDIIKWIQRLSLDNSFKDLKRDLNNGFYFAKIIQKYHPREISLHSFVNTMNKKEKENNWLMLEKVFNKIDFDLKKSEYDKIKDGDIDQLILFVVKLYNKLVGKKIEVIKKPLADLKEGNTKTFLLSETGLEKIDLNKKKLEITENFKEEKLKNNSFDRESEDKENSEEDMKFKLNVDPREIQKIIENQSKKSIASKNSMQSKSKLRSQFNLNKVKSKISVSMMKSKLSKKGRLGNENENPNNKNEEITYKTINERLNEYLNVLDEKYSNECFTVLQQSEYLYYDFSLSVDSFNENFLNELFENIDKEMNIVSKLIIKDETELYKFFIFLINIVINLSSKKTSFVRLMLFIKKFFKLFCDFDSEKCFSLLKHFFLNMILENAKKIDNEKKYFLIKLIFFLLPDDNDEAKDKFFELIYSEKKNRKFSIEIISVLLEKEKSKNDRNASFLNKMIKIMRYVNPLSSINSKIALSKCLSYFCQIDFNYLKKSLEKFKFIFSPKEFSLELKCNLIIFLQNFWLSLSKESNFKINPKKPKTESSFGNTEKIDNRNSPLYDKLLSFLEILLEEENEYFLRIFFINFGCLINTNKNLLKIYFFKLLKSSDHLIEYVFSKTPVELEFAEESKEKIIFTEINELKTEDLFLKSKLTFLLLRNKKKVESLMDLDTEEDLNSYNNEMELENENKKSSNKSLEKDNLIEKLKVDFKKAKNEILGNEEIKETSNEESENFEYNLNQTKNNLEKFADVNSPFKIYEDNKFSNDFFIANSALILQFLLDCENLRKNYIFWRIMKFCFLNCPFEEINYEIFDSLVNKMLNVISKEVKLFKNAEIFEILNRIIEFEIKKQIEIPNFKIKLDKILKDTYFNKDQIQSIFAPLFNKFKLNDIYYSNIKTLFKNNIP